MADRYNRIIVEDLQSLGLSYDLFTRTTTRTHYAVVQEIFTGLLDNGYVFPQTTLGAISPSTGRTLPDRYIEGTCPICGYDQARGDQCDNCGNQLDATDLINPRSRINGETPKFVETEHYFLDLPAFAEVLGSYLRSRDNWRPNVLKFSLNLLDDLRPRAITRDLDWGVPVPLDGWRDRPDKRLYVWFDAVVGYLSASIEWAEADRRPGRVAAVLARSEDGPAATTSWARTTSSSTPRSGRRCCSATPGSAPAAASPARSARWTGRTRWSPASSSPWRASSSPPPGAWSSACATCCPGTTPTRCATTCRWPGRRPRTPTSPGSEFRRRNNDELADSWGNLVNRSVSLAARNVGAVPAPGALTDADARAAGRRRRTPSARSAS